MYCASVNIAKRTHEEEKNINWIICNKHLQIDKILLPENIEYCFIRFEIIIVEKFVIYGLRSNQFIKIIRSFYAFDRIFFHIKIKLFESDLWIVRSSAKWKTDTWPKFAWSKSTWMIIGIVKGTQLCRCLPRSSLIRNNSIKNCS